MERGDLAAVAIALVLVVILTAFFTLTQSPAPVQPTPTPTPAPTPRVTATPTTPVPVTTQVPTVEIPTPQVTTRRIFYTDSYYLLPIRFLPSDMNLYGFSDVPWQYNSSVVFAYIEENHGGITESFTVPYPVWRITATLSAMRTPEKSRFRMIVVDTDTGQVLEGIEIRYPGSVSKTVVARGRPMYLIIGAENVERFMVTLEAPSDYVQ